MNARVQRLQTHLVAWGGDACIATVGERFPGQDDASIPSPRRSSPAPTRLAMTIQNSLPQTL